MWLSSNMAAWDRSRGFCLAWALVGWNLKVLAGFFCEKGWGQYTAKKIYQKPIQVQTLAHEPFSRARLAKALQIPEKDAIHKQIPAVFSNFRRKPPHQYPRRVTSIIMVVSCCSMRELPI